METTETVSFEQRVSRLANYLLRAGKGHTAAVLFAVYLSEFGRAEAERLLAAQLRAAGEQIVRVYVQREGEMVDLPLYLRHHPLGGTAVFFVYHVSRGGEATEQYLNYRREFLIEDQQRLLLWVTAPEMARLARQAPDFWAFRGRTLEFLEQPAALPPSFLAQMTAVYGWNGRHHRTREEVENGIHLREDLLRQLSDRRAYDAQRAELAYTLALQYELSGSPEKTLEVLDRAEPHAPAMLQARFALVRGNALFQLDRYEEARQAFEQALALDAGSVAARNGRAHTLIHLGKYEEAIQEFNETLQAEPAFAAAQAGLGTALQMLGRYDEAIAAYEQANASDPEYPEPWLNKAALLMARNDPVRALESLQRGLSLAPDYREWAQAHPAFFRLRQDPAFRALVGKGLIE